MAPGGRPDPSAVDQGTGGTTLHHNPVESSGAGVRTRGSPSTRSAPKRAPGGAEELRLSPPEGWRARSPL